MDSVNLIFLGMSVTKRNLMLIIKSILVVGFQTSIPFDEPNIQAYLASKGNTPDEVERMHREWCKQFNCKRPFGRELRQSRRTSVQTSGSASE